MAEGVERGDNSAMSQNSSLMSGVDCLLTTWAPDQMSCIVHKAPSPTSSSSTLLWLSKPFLGGVNESRLTKRPALSCAVKSLEIKLSVLFCAPWRCRDLEHWTCAPSPIVGASGSSKRCGSSPPSAGRRQTRRGRRCPKTSLSTRLKLGTAAVT